MFAEGPAPVSGVYAHHRFGLLLAALFGSFFFLGVAPEGPFARTVITVLSGGTLVLALWAAGMPARRLRLATLFIAAAVVAAVCADLAARDDPVIGANAVVNGLLIALAPPAVVLGVIRSFRAHGNVTIDAVAGALCFFLLVGLFFAFLYSATDKLGGDPFFAGGMDATPSRVVYFSFTTLTTVGYGDLAARSDLGHTLSATEALVGQIYLVTVVALIVGNLAPRRAARS